MRRAAPKTRRSVTASKSRSWVMIAKQRCSSATANWKASGGFSEQLTDAPADAALPLHVDGLLVWGMCPLH